MDYNLEKAAAPSAGHARPVPPRPPSGKLRQGGGRKDSPGWTEHKRKANRTRFDRLRSQIKTCLTFVYPISASPKQLVALNEMHRNFCKEHGIPARSVWEGPGKHQHIALGISYDAELKRKWIRRLRKRWLAIFGEPMPENTMLWKAEEEPDKIASYLSKTRDQKSRMIVKGTFEWLTFSPVWETGFKKSQQDFRPETPSRSEACIPRKNEVKPSPEKGGDLNSPDYTVNSSEKRGDPQMTHYTVSLKLNHPSFSSAIRILLVMAYPAPNLLAKHP